MYYIPKTNNYSINYIYNINHWLCNQFLRSNNNSLSIKENIFRSLENYFHLNELYLQLRSFITCSSLYKVKSNTFSYGLKDYSKIIIKEINFSTDSITMDDVDDFYDNKYFYYNYIYINSNIDQLKSKKQYSYYTNNFLSRSITSKKLFSYKSINNLYDLNDKSYLFPYPNKNNLLTYGGILYRSDKVSQTSVISNHNRYVRNLNYYILSTTEKILTNQVLLSSHVNILNNLTNLSLLNQEGSIHNKNFYFLKSDISFSRDKKMNKNLLLLYNSIFSIKKYRFFLEKKLKSYFYTKRIGVITYNNTMRNVFITSSSWNGEHIYHISSGHLKYLGRKKITDSSIHNLVYKFLYKVRTLSIKYGFNYFKIIINGYFDNIYIFLKPILTKYYYYSNTISMLKIFLVFIKKYILYLKTKLLKNNNYLKFNLSQYLYIIDDFICIHKYIEYKSEKHIHQNIHLLDIQIKNKRFFSK